MARRRLIVPDNSVLVPAFFPETREYLGNLFDLTRRARPLRDAILTEKVEAWAPQQLLCEFVGAVYQKAFSREAKNRVDPQHAQEQLHRFLELRINYMRGEQLDAQGRKLAERAWQLSLDYSIPASDSWYVACALEKRAELWLSHPHEDGLADNARRAGADVRLLTAEKFA